MPHADPIAHGEHVMTVCNACRYCEQFCPVFPAMENRLTFAEADLAYLANLCHNCGECLYACQYAPPHEFGINVPRTMAEIRAHSYEAYCWPSVPVERLQASQPVDRPRSRRRTDRGDGRRRSDRQRRCVPPAGWRRAISTVSFRTTSWSRSSAACSCSCSWRSGSASSGSGATCGAATHTSDRCRSGPRAR